MNVVGERIRELRVERGMKQDDLAKALGIARNTISHYEIGRHEPPLDIVIALSKIFSVSSDYLLGIKDFY